MFEEDSIEDTSEVKKPLDSLFPIQNNAKHLEKRFSKKKYRHERYKKGGKANKLKERKRKGNVKRYSRKRKGKYQRSKNLKVHLSI